MNALLADFATHSDMASIAAHSAQARNYGTTGSRFRYRNLVSVVSSTMYRRARLPSHTTLAAPASTSTVLVQSEPWQVTHLDDEGDE